MKKETGIWLITLYPKPFMQHPIIPTGFVLALCIRTGSVSANWMQSEGHGQRGLVFVTTIINCKARVLFIPTCSAQSLLTRWFLSTWWLDSVKTQVYLILWPNNVLDQQSSDSTKSVCAAKEYNSTTRQMPNANDVRALATLSVTQQSSWQETNWLHRSCCTLPPKTNLICPLWPSPPIALNSDVAAHPRTAAMLDPPNWGLGYWKTKGLRRQNNKYGKKTELSKALCCNHVWYGLDLFAELKCSDVSDFPFSIVRLKKTCFHL